MYQLVVINYFKNQVAVHTQQLLFVHQIGDQTALDDFDNTDVRLLIDHFIAHNFSLAPELEIYYYIDGLNDAQTPFYYGRVVDSLKSPYTRQTNRLRFGDQGSKQATSSHAGAVSASSAAKSSGLIDPVKSSNSTVPVDLERGEPDAVFEQLMRQKRSKTKDGDHHGKR